MSKIIDLGDEAIKRQPECVDDRETNVVFADEVVEYLISIIADEAGPREVSEEELDKLEDLWNHASTLMSELLYQ